MRPTLHEKTLALVLEHIAVRGELSILARDTATPYHRLWHWVKRDARRIDVDTVQRLYEHLTGKQLEY